MRFSNGCWIQKEGCECFAPQEVYYTNIESNKVILCAPTYHVRGRGDTLGNVNLTLEISSPAENILRIKTYHFKGAIVDTPAFDLSINENNPLKVVETDDEIKIYTAENEEAMYVIINKKQFNMKFYRKNRLITSSTGKDLALMKTNWKGLAYDPGDNEETYIRQMLSLAVDEKIYGMGERFTPFIKNGQTVDMWNADGGTSTYQSYKNIPFYISDKGYGVLVNHPEEVSFEVATEMVTRTQFSVKGSYLDYFIIDGPSMKEVLKRYTDLSGKPSLPAPWTFGLWLSTSFTTSYDEDTVMSFVNGMLDRDIPMRTIHFDSFWQKEFHWCEFLWDNRVFPDPKGMLKRMHEKGMKVCVWINSYIGQESAIFDEGMNNGYFIKRTNGQVWQWDMWQPGMAIVDFTNPSAYKWFQDKLEVLIDMGVDCFKTDFGERIPTEDVKFFDGSDPYKMHNLYTYLFNKCVYELLERKKGKGEAVLFARSATVGGQKFPVHWGGDCWSDYESMEESLRGGLSLLMSGFGYWAHDIGGFENTSTADVYKRWVAFGLLSSHSRLHGSSSYRVPWVYDDEAVDVVRFFTKLKAKMMPYIYKTSVETSKTGIPTMRAMVLEFPEDKTCHYLDKQYMLGDNLLVAPIFNDESKAEYYLPEGKWTDFFTNKEYDGGKWITEDCSYLSIPLMVKPNSIIVLGYHDDRPDYDYEKDACVKVYGLEDGAMSSTVIYGQDNVIKTKISVSRNGSTVKLNVTGAKNLSVELVNLSKEIININGDKEISVSI